MAVQGAFLYGLIILYPAISVAILMLTGSITSFFTALKNEFYLWLGITILYIALIFILLTGLKVVIPPLIDFIIYTIFYFGVSLVRKFVITDSVDIFEKAKQVPIIKGKE